MPVWAGCEKYLKKALQIIQNKAARTVTRLPFDTSVKKLLGQCGWLSVNQLGTYHSLVTHYKILQNKCPKYLYDKYNERFPRLTRLNDDTNAIKLPDPKLKLTENSFR